MDAGVKGAALGGQPRIAEQALDRPRHGSVIGCQGDRRHREECDKLSQGRVHRGVDSRILSSG